MVAYTYTPLNDPCMQIRVLQLQPGSCGVPLSFNSSIHALDDESNDYHALSYEWGLPEPKQVVLIDGEILEIRQNLWLFLKEIRSQMAADLPLRLWCDAICIDQGSISEKNHQVGMMAQIYAKAKGVFAWLGEGTVESNELLRRLDETIQRLPEAALRAWKPSQFAVGSQARQILAQEFRTPGTINMCEAIHNLLNRPYWRRVWIVQEMLIPQEITLFCGSRQLQDASLALFHAVGYGSGLWKMLDRVSRVVRRKKHVFGPRRPEPKDTSAWEVIAGRSSHSEASTDLHHLVYRYRKSLCEISHDHIYALLALANEIKTGNPYPIDYNCTTETLLQDFVLFYGGKVPLKTMQSLFARLKPDLTRYPRVPCQDSQSNYHLVESSRLKKCSLDTIFVGSVSKVTPFPCKEVPEIPIELWEEEGVLAWHHLFGQRAHAGDSVWGIQTSRFCLIRRSSPSGTLSIVGVAMRFFTDSPVEKAVGWEALRSQGLFEDVIGQECSSAQNANIEATAVTVKFSDVMFLLQLEWEGCSGQWQAYPPTDVHTTSFISPKVHESFYSHYPGHREIVSLKLASARSDVSHASVSRVPHHSRQDR